MTVDDTEYAKHWPQMNIDFRLLEGACETGTTLWLIGSFGGFGGTFLYDHSDKTKALAHLEQMNDGNQRTQWQLYSLNIEAVR